MRNSFNQNRNLQEKLELSELKFRTVAEATTDSILITDEDTIIIFFNSAALDTFGYTENEILGKPLSILIPERYIELYKEYVARFRTSERLQIKGRQFEMEALRKDGTTFPVELSISYWNELEDIFFTGIIRDITQRRKAETELLEREEKYRLLAKNSSDLISKLSPEGEIIYVSPSCEQVLGYKQKELIETNAYELYHPDDFEVMNKIYEDILKDNDITTVTYRVRKKDGTYIWLESTNRTIRDDNGNPIEMQCSSRDITERKKTEDELLDNQYFIHRVTDSSPIIITVYDIINERNVYANKEFTEVLGYTEKDLEWMGSETLKRLIHEDDLDDYLRSRVKLDELQDGETREIELRAKHFNGSYLWFLLKENIFKRTEEGAVWQVLTISLDITDKKRAETTIKQAKEELRTLNRQLEGKVQEQTAELRKSENLLRNITSTIPAFVSYLDKNLVYQFTNEYYTRLSFIKSSPVGKHISDVIEAGLYEKVRESIDKALNGEAASRVNKVTLKDGTKKNIEVSYLPDKNESGEVQGIILMGIDLTERLQHENELSQKNEELSKTNNDLDNFIYTASHDLKAPISNIEGLKNAIKGLKSYKTDKELKELIDMMEFSIDKFKNTIIDLTEISQIQRQQDEPEESVKIEDVAEEIEFLLKDLIQTTKAKITYSFDIPEIQFSKRNFRSIIYNLTSNALKYHSPERLPEIFISTKREKECVSLIVRDNGLGIPDERKENIFSMFKRYHMHVEGSGVGLYIVKRIVENAGGKIEIESEVDKGTTIKIFFKE